MSVRVKLFGSFVNNSNLEPALRTTTPTIELGHF